MAIFGLILAGGAGRRMGGADKALLRLAGRPLIAHAIERLAPQVDRLAISANGDPARLDFTGLPVLGDAAAGRGPLEGVLAGLRWAQAGGATALMTVAVDSPLFPTDLVARLTAAGAPAMARSDDRDHPTFTLWPVSAAPEIEEWLDAGERRLMTLMDRIGAHAVDLPAGSITNLNTPEDLARAEAALR